MVCVFSHWMRVVAWEKKAKNCSYVFDGWKTLITWEIEKEQERIGPNFNQREKHTQFPTIYYCLLFHYFLCGFGDLNSYYNFCVAFFYYQTSINDFVSSFLFLFCVFFCSKRIFEVELGEGKYLQAIHIIHCVTQTLTLIAFIVFFFFYLNWTIIFLHSFL